MWTLIFEAYSVQHTNVSQTNVKLRGEVSLHLKPLYQNCIIIFYATVGDLCICTQLCFVAIFWSCFIQNYLMNLETLIINYVWSLFVTLKKYFYWLYRISEVSEICGHLNTKRFMTQTYQLINKNFTIFVSLLSSIHIFM